MTGSLLNQGFMLLAFGMGTVFVFLAVLVLSTLIMSQLINRLLPEPEIEPVTPIGGRQVKSETQLISVISAAIQQYKKDKNN